MNRVKTVALVAAVTLVISVAATFAAGNFHPSDSDLVVHEWGTFTSVAGEDGAALDWRVLGGKNDLPHFVNDKGYRNFKSNLSGTVRMETPVIYFYSPRPLTAHVRVAFPKGLITEWYPQADTSMPRGISGIDWKSVSVEPDTAPALPREDTPSRYYAARATDAAPISVGNQHEKFLFYRGVAQFGIPLSARLAAGGNVVLENCGADQVPVAIRFENHGGRIGYRMGNAVSGSLTLDPPPMGVAGIAPLTKDLKKILVAQGLYPKEAQAMVETWRDSWFEEGSRVIYIVPSEMVSRVLPLQIDPVPSQTVRVFVGRIELITPETMRSVETAMAANDRCAIDRYDRFLEPILSRIVSQNPKAAPRIEQFRASLGRKSCPLTPLGT